MKNEHFTVMKQESATLIRSGSDFFDRLEKLINEATAEIHFQTYILEDDRTGNRITDALKKAALRKVKVYLLVDGLGSRALTDRFISDLRSSGIQFRFFSPLFSRHSLYFLYFGRRLHHKVVVVDAQTVLIGGINIAEKYEGRADKAPWLDFAVMISDATTAKQVGLICNYYFLKKRKLAIARRPPDILKKTAAIKLLQNDWLRRKNEIQKAYIRAIYRAKNEIIIVCSYFLPGRKLTWALKKAAQKNVRIRLILSGVSDVPLVKQAINFYYPFLLRNNIELYEWNESILHGKTAVIDQQWTTIGSFNLNHLSSYASIEMNVEIQSESFSRNYQNQLEEIISRCHQITPETFQKRNGPLSRFKDWLSYYTVRFFETLLTFVPHNRILKRFLK